MSSSLDPAYACASTALAAARSCSGRLPVVGITTPTEELMPPVHWKSSGSSEIAIAAHEGTGESGNEGTVSCGQPGTPGIILNEVDGSDGEAHGIARGGVGDVQVGRGAPKKTEAIRAGGLTGESRPDTEVASAGGLTGQGRPDTKVARTGGLTGERRPETEV